MRRVHHAADAQDPRHDASTPKKAQKQVSADVPAPLEGMLESLQRSAGNAAVSRLLAHGPQRAAESSTGDPLPPGIRTAAERRLGADLGEVRLHSDAAAATYADGLGAEAVTVGQDIFMSAGSAFDSARGRETLMHELVHTVQSAGASRSGTLVVSNAGGAAEHEASSIATTGLQGTRVAPSQVAPAGIAHRKVIDEEEKAPPKEANLDFLGPLPEAAGGAKPGESGGAESVAYEITVMQPLRKAMAAIEEQDWEGALAVLQSIGMPLLDYQNAYEKRDPMLYALLMSARGWLSVLYGQLNRRLDQGSWTDDQMTANMRDYVAEFERIEPKL